MFRDRFKSEPILNYDYLYKCIKYVHMNPVKARICKNQADYLFSSYRGYINKDFLDDNLYREIFQNESNWEYVINNEINFNNNFLDEKFSLEDAKKWLEVFSNNAKNNYPQKDFERKMIVGLHRECKNIYK